MADYSSGVIFTSALPAWQRVWYEEKLLETVRMNSILVPFTNVKTDPAAVRSGQIVYTEVYDIEPNWNPTSENTIWFKGGALDSRTVTITVEPYHDILKFSDYHNLLDYINNGQIPALVMEKVGQSLTDTLDILARNAFLAHPYPTYAGTATSRTGLGANDLFDINIAELVRTHLEEAECPGVASNTDGGGQAVIAIVTSRVAHDIRTASGSEWIDAQNYVGTNRRFTSEIGQWGGVRFLKTNRLRLDNCGQVLAQTTLSAATVPGQGAASTVDTVYSPGQPGSTRYVTVESVSGFAVGQKVTIHKGTSGNPPVESDGTQETRRIVSIDTTNKRLSFDKPLLKDHDAGDLVTHGRDVHATIFIGGPTVVWAIAERPTMIFPPKMDDAMMVNRVGWRGLFKFQLFRPEWHRVHYSAGSTN